MDATSSKILRDRAAALAREPEREVEGEQIAVVEFALGKERYAFAAEHVREVVALKDFSPLPCTPRFVVGIMNLRGEVLTVIDLGALFELPAGGITDLNRVVILTKDGAQIGVVADAILGARSLRADELQSSLPTLTGIHGGFLRGITADRLIVLDAVRLFMEETLVVREEVGG